MAIVSMSTESYLNWLHHFLTSLQDKSTDEKCLIFLINVSQEMQKKFKEKFPNVEFINEKKQLIQKTPNDKKVFRVTYLKGEFMEKAWIRLGEPLLWIDCTAMINKTPESLLEMLEPLKVILMRRNFENDFGKAVYAAEIFGMNDLETIKEYRANCEKRQEEWFSDQLALCEIKTQVRRYIEFGDWSNFYYDEKASSWSDRGKTGSGILNQEDYDFTENKFIENLEKRIPGYKKEFSAFFGIPEQRPKILVHIDATDWCYHTTVMEVTKRLPNYEFLIIEDAKKDLDKYKNWNGDLVWARCSSKRHQKLLRFRPDLRSISFSSITTGGELAEDRITAHLNTNQAEAGVICQNEDAKFRIEHKLKKLGRDQEVFILHNGVDTERFKPSKLKIKNKVVGFVGRNKTYQEDFIKGFSTILIPVAEKLGLKVLVASNKKEEVQDHNQMPKFYRKIDILVLLGNCEGHSNTINEAMSSGIPVIAYPVAWHSEKAKNQGILWCHRSTVELLAILSDFKKNFKKYGYLGEKNRKFAENVLSWDFVCKHYDRTFQNMLKHTKTRKTMIIEPTIDKKVDEKVLGITEVKYIAQDGGMINDWGLFKPGKTYKVSSEAYNYFKAHFPNKFDFGTA